MTYITLIMLDSTAKRQKKNLTTHKSLLNKYLYSEKCSVTIFVTILALFFTKSILLFRLIHALKITINRDMRKTWIYKRKGIKGWWVGWYESGKRKAKALPSKAMAEHYRQIKYAQLNSDVFTGTISVE